MSAQPELLQRGPPPAPVGEARRSTSAVAGTPALLPTAAPRPVPAALKWYASVLIQTRKRLRGFFLGVASLALFVLTWHLATRYKLDFYIRFGNIPTPGDVLAHASVLFHTHAFYENMLISLRRILIGFSIATLLGVAMGVAIGRYRIVRELSFPSLEVLRPIPAIAWVPMSVMLWPSNETSIVFITFLGSFFPILLNTIHGVQSLDSVLIRAALCLGAKESALIREVILPGALPHIFTGLSVGMGVAWVSLIAAEMISGQFGIGYFTWEAYSLIQYADIAIGMIVIGVLGLACSGAIRLTSRLLIRWPT